MTTPTQILILIMVYILLMVIMLQYVKKNPLNPNGPSSKHGDDEDENGNGGGGWEKPPVDPPLDLPPGVYILPPGVDDPSECGILDTDYS